MDRRRNNRTAATALAAVAAAVALMLFYYNVDPELPFMPRCVFRAATGYDCPGCGFQRALHALLHGRVADAWGYNAFAFFAVPAALFFTVAELGRRRWPRLARIAFHPAVIAGVFVAMIAWWIGRNIC